jgi:hypothetical protein
MILLRAPRLQWIWICWASRMRTPRAEQPKLVRLRTHFLVALGWRRQQPCPKLPIGKDGFLSIMPVYHVTDRASTMDVQLPSPSLRLAWQSSCHGGLIE